MASKPINNHQISPILKIHVLHHITLTAYGIIYKQMKPCITKIDPNTALMYIMFNLG